MYRYNNATGTVSVEEAYTGDMTLVPYGNNYTIGTSLVQFAEGTETCASQIVVRKYASKTSYDDTAYCVAADGTLQYRNPAAKIGETEYPTLAEAIAAAEDGAVIEVIRDVDVDATLTIDKNVTITNEAGKDVVLTRTDGITVFNVAAGNSLTLGSENTTNTITVNGGYDADAETPITGNKMVDAYGTFTLGKNATLTNANGGTDDGAALYIEQGAVANLYGNVTNNTSNQGGAIRAYGALNINGATLSGNEASNGSGGAIYSSGAVTIDNAIICNNKSTATAGAIYASGTLTMSNSQCSENEAGTGGGFMNVAGTATWTNVVVYNNTIKNASYGGGATYVSGGKNLTLEGCNIYGNAKDYKSTANPGEDISLGANTVLHVKDNENIGVVLYRYNNAIGTVSVEETYTGAMTLVPYGNDYTIGTALVQFAEGTEACTSQITVRKYASKNSYDDETYCVAADGTLQYADPEAMIGNITYLTLDEAIAAAVDNDTVYVCKDVNIASTMTVGTSEETKNITVTNKDGMDVVLTRTQAGSMFEVAEGSNLTIGCADGANTITLDGGYDEGATTPLKTVAVVKNAGTFTLEAKAIIQNAVTGGSDGNNANYLGGGLSNQGTATVKGTIRNCSAFNGGAIINDSTLYITETAYFTGNVADGGNGGVLRNKGTANVTGATFEENIGKGANKGNGAAIYNSGTLTTNGVTYKNNVGRSGGAIYHDGGTMTLQNDVFIGNKATNGTENCPGNGGGTGGAIIIANKAATVSIENSEFVGNSSASNDSAAIDVRRSITLKGCNIHDNVSSETSENALYDIRLYGAITLNVDEATQMGVVYYQNANAKINIQKDFAGSGLIVPNNYNANAQLLTFADDVADKTSAISGISIGKVVSGVVYESDLYYVDADGKLQVRSEAAKVGTAYYDTLADAIAGVADGESATVYMLQDTDISAALSISENKNITIKNAVGEDVTLTRTAAGANFEVAAGSSLTVAGNTGGSITLDGGTTQTTSLVKNAGTFVLGENATIQNAKTGSSKNDADHHGGALYNTGTATIQGTITGCSAYNGGAILNAANATMTLTSTAVISNNLADKGNGGALRNLGTLTITGATLAENKAQGSYGNGGAIFNTGTLVSENAVYEGNVAKVGGAIYHQTSGTITTITGGVFRNNSANLSADGTGGAVYVRNDSTANSVTITAAEFTGNTCSKDMGAAIDAQKTITIVDCNIHDNVSTSGDTFYDILVGNATLNVGGNTSATVCFSNANGKVTELSGFTGEMVIEPYSN